MFAADSISIAYVASATVKGFGVTGGLLRMLQLTEEGDFQADVYDHGFKESQAEGSNAMAVHLACVATHRLDYKTGQWIPMEGGPWCVEGDIYHVNRDGTEDSLKVEILKQALGWDGEAHTMMGVDPTTFEALPLELVWKPNRIQIKVKRDDYKGVPKFKIDRVSSLGTGARTVTTPATASRLALKASKARSRATGGSEAQAGSTTQVPESQPDGAIPF